jgi:HEAT repeat protein
MFDHLKRKLEIGSASEREAAARELEKLGSHEAVELLRFAAKDDSRYVRQTATDALRNLGYSSPGSPSTHPPTPESAIGGYVYLLVNHAMPGLVKIGYTARTVAERVAELTTATGVPMPFVCAYDHPVPDPVKAESEIHEALKTYRCSEGREFFRIEPAAAIRIIQTICPAVSEFVTSKPGTIPSPRRSQTETDK